MSQTSAKALILDNGGVWYGQSGRMPCIICQSDERCTNPALDLRDEGGKLLAFCHKCHAPFTAILEALRARDIHIPRERYPTPEQLMATLAQPQDDKTEYAGQLFRETVPIPGTPAELYLRGRGITLDVDPQVIRYHSRLRHPSRTYLPAMVAKVVGVDGKGLGIHRTYLDPNGVKSLCTPNKMMLGPTRGGAVRLAEGDSILLGEGIESVLAAMQLSGQPGYASCSE